MTDQAIGSNSIEPIAPDRFRQIMGNFPSGVTVVTARREGEASVGFTASSVSSTSLDPPLILVCVARQLYTLSVIRDTGFFALNFLRQGQEAIARWFSTSSNQPKFTPEAWRRIGLREVLSPRNVPILDGSLAYAECQVHNIFDGGDHAIVVGRVVDGAGCDATPLTYLRRQYAEWPDAEVTERAPERWGD
jgi:flavin reductase (DIM6/NTAB) family NADH-FMN oxidoreductase RutF